MNIPKILREDLGNTVAVYGETAPGDDVSCDDVPCNGRPFCGRGPAIWVAERLGTGERFERAIQPNRAPTASFFKHLEIPEDAFLNGISMEQFRIEWQSFLLPADSLVYYFSNCTNLLKTIGGSPRTVVYLKSIQLHRGQKNGTLEDLLGTLGVSQDFLGCGNRACKRLAGTIALARFFHQCDLGPDLTKVR